MLIRTLLDEESASRTANCVAVVLSYYVVFVVNNYGALCVRARARMCLHVTMNVLLLSSTKSLRKKLFS
jgi:hypothetical protein